ncbi:MAG: small subunit ribosomal protein S15 [Candidatus Berkelbacteria bacterium Licking1014_2]|uniref:Small ribosomal subunit protein uS15 n=1 Tax=Candidatus Berkelbacteria bacterium Licking1014_2 TaxID=2017146 RepID=A0A554LSG5_9BACT|nr:MAG: small subunit ribosomal protein S15 [Candidatus Berkelbacteria bacterium Licking1014_2]
MAQKIITKKTTSKKITPPQKTTPKTATIKKPAAKKAAIIVDKKVKDEKKQPSLDKEESLANKYARSEEDTGSTEVQIAGLTQRIEELTKHLKKHRGDNDSRRGLLLLVSRRRRLLNYLLKTDPEKYQQLIIDLKLKK